MFALPQCFVITIEPMNGVRRQSAARQLEAVGVDFRFVEGVEADGPEVNVHYDKRLNSRLMKRPLSRGEVAAYLSHRRALEAFIETDAEFALVLEDDFALIELDHFVEAITSILRAPARWDLIKLFDYRGPKRPRARLDLGRLAIVEYKSQTSGMVGYLVRRSGARKIMLRPRLFRPIDEDIKFYWEMDLRAFSVTPNLVAEISDTLGGSAIEPERRRLRDDRSIGRSLRGNGIKLGHMWRHFLNRRRYGLRSAMQAYAQKDDADTHRASDRD